MKIVLQVCFVVVMVALEIFIAYAKPVSIDEARVVAINFYSYIKGLPVSSVRIVYEEAYTYKGYVTRYVFVFDGNDFVIVSGDDRTVPIFAYSTEGSWGYSDMPPAYKDWVEVEYDMWVKYVQENNIKDTSFIYKWRELESGEISSYKVLSTQGVGPLLTTKWGQSKSNDSLDACAYNYYVPNKAGGCYCGNKCAAGCVAVAMAQIMRYWKSPADRFEWCLMPDELRPRLYPGNVNNIYYISKRNAVAELIRDCGLKVNMSYCDQGSCESGAYSKDARKAFVNSYNYHASYVHYRWYLLPIWNTLLRANLDKKYPVYYRGENSNGSGHAFVCDGYKGKNMFHFNFGWNGIKNGYYYINNKKNPNILYTKFQAAIFNIFPKGGVKNCNECIDNNFVINKVVGNVNYYGNSIPEITWSYTLPPNYEWRSTLIGKKIPFCSSIVTKNNQAVLSYCEVNARELNLYVTIPSNIDITFNAENYILITNSHIQEGAYFTARILPCPNFQYRQEKSISLQDYDKELVGNFIRVFPNPFTDFINVEATSKKGEEYIVKIMIIDEYGRVLLSYDNSSKIGTIKLKLVGIPKGVYVCRIVTNITVYNKKIIKL